MCSRPTSRRKRVIVVDSLSAASSRIKKAETRTTLGETLAYQARSCEAKQRTNGEASMHMGFFDGRIIQADQNATGYSRRYGK
jgi:hypothetical protein